jgi:hypothetical protein
MADAPNPADFSVNEREGEYEVVFGISGQMHVTINAASRDEAKAQAERMAEAMWDDLDEIEIDDPTEIRVAWVNKTRPLFRVLRDGQKIQVSRLMAGDLPRQPNENGF